MRPPPVALAHIALAFREAAALHGVDADAIPNSRIRTGAPTAARHAAIMRLHGRGYAPTAIAVALSVSRRSVVMVLAAHGRDATGGHDGR